MGLLDLQPKKKPGLLANAPTDYSGTLGDLGTIGMPKLTTKTSTQAIPDATTGDTITAVKDIAQAIPRDAASVGISFANLFDKGTVGKKLDPTKMGKLGPIVLGKEPIAGLPDTAASYEAALARKGIHGAPGTGLAVLGATVPVALDFLGLGGEKEAVATIIRTQTEKEAADALVKLGITEDVARQFAPRAVAASTRADAKALFADIAKVAKPAAVEDAAKALAEDIPPEIKAQAEKDWQENFSDSALKLADEVSALQNEIKVAKASERPALQASLDAAIKSHGELESSFIQKWQPQVDAAPPVPSVTPVLQPLAEKVKTMTLEEFTTKFNDTLASQNLTKKETAQNVLKEMQSAGFNSPEDFYTKITSTPTREPMVEGAQGATGSRPTSQIPQEEIPSPAPQSTLPSAELSLPEVNHVPTELARPFQQVVGIGAQTTKEPNLYKRVTGKLGKAFESVVEYVQDSEVKVRKLMERTDVTVTDASNRYQKATLYPGRVAVKIEEARAQMETIANDLVDIADSSGRDIPEIRADVNEYLQATHAPERNARLGDGAAGMTNDEAKAALERINSLPDAAAIKKIAESAKKLNDEGLVLLHEAGVISDELYGALTSRYKNHVPLNRVFDQTEDIGGALSSVGFDVRSTGIKRAKGSDREVADILSNIQHNYEQAVLRSEKNIVDQATLEFVRDNREALAGLMEVRKPKAIGKTFDDKILLEKTNDPSYLQLYEKGQPVWIKVTDPALAVALRGIGREKLPTLLNAVGTFTRFYAGLATRFNPEFAFPNKLRDLQETMIYMAAQKDVGFQGAAKVMLKDPGSTKAVWDAIRGADTPGARLYEEMRSLGGTTGGFGLSTRAQVELDIERMIETAKSAPKQTAADVIKYIDNWNTVFEDSTRLSVYKQALSQGLSKERAAFLAKEASINFNRMGRGGPVINAIWMFSNASIQGSVKMVRSLKSPKVAATVIATVGGAVAAVNEWNDRVDPQWRDKITKWDRLNGLPVVIPNAKGEGVSYFVIPVSWGVKPIKVMADYAYDAASGKETNLPKMSSDLFTSVVDAYNPLGGTDVVSALTPTVLDVPVEIVRNQSWSGSKIRPDFDKNAPKDVQYFSALGETASGKAFIQGTKALQEYTGITLSPADVKYAFDQYIGGAGKAGAKAANTAIGVAEGTPPPADEFPFISRFYRTRTQEEIGQGAGGETEQLKSVLENQSRARFYETQAAEDKFKILKELPKEEANAQWHQINKENPTLAAKIADIAKQDKKGLDYSERLLTQLGVQNGERAKYLYDKFNALQSTTDKNNLWSDYSKKGIITKAVADQLRYLFKNPMSKKQSNDGTASRILGMLTGADTAHAAENTPPNYYIRDNTVTPADLEEAKAVLFGEVSNRTPEKQKLEAQTILNTAFNRMDEFRARGTPKTLTEVLQMDNQYQAYKGKEYGRYKAGSIRATDKQKTDAIEAMIAKVKDGTFQNNIGGAAFYSHKPDGRIIAVDKKLFKS